MIHPNHKAYLDNLTQDVENVSEKPYTKTALVSHLYRAFKGLTRDEAREVVTEYMEGLKCMNLTI